MGKKTKNLQSRLAERPRQSRLCDWCRLPAEDGSLWDGQWVCSSCFPTEAVERKKEERKLRTCSCGRKSREGTELLGQWLCSVCSNRVTGRGGSRKQHKNKYAHFSHIDRTTVDCIVKPKPKRKEKKRKLKKIEYWVVVITDISDGKL